MKGKAKERKLKRKGALTEKRIDAHANLVDPKKPFKTLVENMVKKNCSHFPIAVFLTTLVCSH